MGFFEDMLDEGMRDTRHVMNERGVSYDEARWLLRESDLLEANNRYLEAARIARRAARGGFQGRVDPWLLACFGEAIARDTTERSHRFLEEALETVQASGTTRSEAHQLVDYVFDRPAGDLPQEIGGVMVTLAALCLAHGVDMAEAGEVELARIWTKVETIRAKQAAKPKHSPLPEAEDEAKPRYTTRRLRQEIESQTAQMRAERDAALHPPLKTLDEWHEDHGSVVWWAWRDGEWLGEPAYIGTPLDLGRTYAGLIGDQEFTVTLGGWPGYHTHWTPHPDFPTPPAGGAA